MLGDRGGVPIGYAKPKSGRLDGVKIGVLGNFESENA